MCFLFPTPEPYKIYLRKSIPLLIHLYKYIVLDLTLNLQSSFDGSIRNFIDNVLICIRNAYLFTLFFPTTNFKLQVKKICTDSKYICSSRNLHIWKTVEANKISKRLLHEQDSNLKADTKQVTCKPIIQLYIFIQNKGILYHWQLYRRKIHADARHNKQRVSEWGRWSVTGVSRAVLWSTPCL